MPTVVPKLGEPIYGTQKRWEYTREAENKSRAWCSNFYAKVAEGVASGTATANAGR